MSTCFFDEPILPSSHLEREAVLLDVGDENSLPENFMRALDDHQTETVSSLDRKKQSDQIYAFCDQFW